MMAMHRVMPALALLGLLGCGPADPQSANAAQTIDDPASLEPAPPTAADGQQRAGKRSPAPMPETFAGFPRPELATLDGVWIVDVTPPHRGLVWVIEEQGSKLTTVDRHGRETVHDMTLSSPCALRMIDDDGRALTRSIALVGDELFITGKGAIAVAAPDGSLLACVGHRTYQIAADGRCRYTTELLGAWSDPVDAAHACALATVDGVRTLTIAGQQLREQDGVWLDELAAAGVAVRMDDRAAALAAIAPPPAAEPTTSEPEPTTSETG